MLKFDGKLEVNSGNYVPTELDQEQLIPAVKEEVQRYGLRSFFYVLWFNNKVEYLVDEPLLFILQEMIVE